MNAPKGSGCLIKMALDPVLYSRVIREQVTLDAHLILVSKILLKYFVQLNCKRFSLQQLEHREAISLVDR